MDRDLLLVHRREARFEVDEARARRPGDHVTDLELRPFLGLLPLEAVRRAFAPEELEEALRIPVGVDVDRVHWKKWGLTPFSSSNRFTISFASAIQRAMSSATGASVASG